MTNFQKRIREYSQPNHSEWRGQSTRENIDRWSKRAEKESDGDKHRAKGGEVELPSTGEMRVHSTRQEAGHTGDFYEAAKRDLNRDLNNPYQRGIRRIT
jgi:hypothetical protein